MQCIGVEVGCVGCCAQEMLYQFVVRGEGVEKGIICR